MAERGNTTHGSEMDDKMKEETQGLEKGNDPTRAEEGREKETVEDDTENAPDPVTDSIGSVTDTSDKKDVEAHDVVSEGGETP